MSDEYNVDGDSTQDHVVIYKEDFNKLYDIVDCVLDTQYNQDNQKWVAAMALQNALDEAVENDTTRLIFTPEEVACIASLYTEE